VIFLLFSHPLSQSLPFPEGRGEKIGNSSPSQREGEDKGGGGE